LKKKIPYARIAGITAVIISMIWFADWLSGEPDYSRNGLFILLSGILFGIVLQRSRFCFYCILGDFFLRNNGKPLIGIITALLVGGICYQILFSSWISDPSAGYLPPEAHIGPAGWHLLVGGLIFGWGMVLSGSCISAHLYRIGEGSVLAPVALAGTIPGFILAYMFWNTLYLRTIISAPVIWYPSELGYTAAFLIQNILLLGLLILLIIKFPGPEVPDEPAIARNSLRYILKKVFKLRWPSWVGGIGVGLIGVFYYFRVEPLGVTAEIGRLSRITGEKAGLTPDTLLGFDKFSGCIPSDISLMISSNGIFVVALVAGALISGLAAGKFHIRMAPVRKFIFALAGGVLLGFGAMISLGCTIGTTLSGIMAYAASGWIFTFGMIGGVWSGLKIKNRNR
jgi:uncharacterized protein